MLRDYFPNTEEGCKLYGGFLMKESQQKNYVVVLLQEKE